MYQLVDALDKLLNFAIKNALLCWYSRGYKMYFMCIICKAYWILVAQPDKNLILTNLSHSLCEYLSVDTKTVPLT